MKEKLQEHFKNHFDQFYSKYLPSVKKIGGQEYQALCPFHADTKPSFNFNNETGTYFCHGCEKKGAMFHFYAKTHNLDDRKDFPKILKGIASDFGIPFTEQQRKLVKTYDYTDPEGNLTFQVCRYEPKNFSQRQPDGNGGWTYNLKGIKPTLYRLPEVIKANLVLINEGEKDADSCHILGFTATTNPMGVKKWKDEFNEYLKGKDLVLFPDNDTEGREHMLRVAQSINGRSASLKMIELRAFLTKEILQISFLALPIHRMPEIKF